MNQVAVMKSNKKKIELSALEKRHIGAQKYPKARQIRTGDKAICLEDSATE